MAQSDFGIINPDEKSGTALATDLNLWRNALHTLHFGSTRPSYAQGGLLWLQDFSSTEWRLYVYDGTDDILVGTINPQSNTFSPAGVSGYAPLAGATFTGAVIVPNATADNHALNRITADGRYAMLSASSVTFSGMVRLAQTLFVDRVDSSSEGGRVVLRRASDNADAYQLQAFGSGSSPVFRVVRLFGTPAEVFSIDENGRASVPGSPTSGNHVANKTYVDSFLAAAKCNVQQFDASGTWTKPTGYDPNSLVRIQCWAGGASGARHSTPGQAGGGGGGGYNERWMRLSALGATETVTIGAGGAAVSGSNANGNPGGNTSFGAHVTAYGGAGGNINGNGGGGGGPLGAGSGTNAGAPNFGQGTGGTDVAASPGFWHGGGGGGSSNGFGGVPAGAASIWGGGGGGANTGSGNQGGASINGGAGGAGGGATGTAGSAPGGGGGAGTSTSGAGAAGRVIVTVFAV